jgi:long-subunit acyl-CoA synthetase (AMP-forming)
MIYPTIKELYINSIKSFAKRPVSSLFNGESLSYEQFDERVKQLVDIFRKAGLTKGDKVALLSSNMPNWSVCYFATVISGMVIVPILPDFSADAISGILDHSESKALFVSDKLYAKVPKCCVPHECGNPRCKSGGDCTQGLVTRKRAGCNCRSHTRGPGRNYLYIWNYVIA